tara:strand:- start:115 stop:618 length:504 start_codon:yes stop_codon:yes gene_type:complete
MTRIFLMAGLSAFALAACSEGEMTDNANNVGDDMEAAANDMADAGNDVVDEAMNNVEAGMDEFDEAMETRAIDGRWGIQYEACSETNDMRDGVIVISRYDILVGLDQCSITGADQASDGVTRFTAECEGGEGEQYSREFYFSSPQDGVLRWDNREMGRVEDYVSCEA